LTILGPAEQARASEDGKRLERLADEVLRCPALEELALALAGCRAFVGCDSGITHLAAMVGIPTLALFGPTDPCRWGPIGKKASILLGGRLMVSPEWLRNSPGTYPPARMDAISLGIVAEWIRNQIVCELPGES
jgi:ADP-heptose:LPS heptosyltransferase